MLSPFTDITASIRLGILSIKCFAYSMSRRAHSRLMHLTRPCLVFGLRVFNIFSVGFKSGLWVGQLIHATPLSFLHLSASLLRCLGSLSSRSVHLPLLPRLLKLAARSFSTTLVVLYTFSQCRTIFLSIDNPCQTSFWDNFGPSRCRENNNKFHSFVDS